MFHLAFTCRPRTFPEFSKPQAWYPCGKIGRGWSPPEDGWGRYTCPGWGIPNLAKTIDLLAGGHALLGWKKLCTYQLTCLTKNCWYLGWIHKSMYMEQSYASLGWGMFNQKNILRSISTGWDLAFVAPNQLAFAGSNIFLGLVRTCCNNINRGLNWASCLVPTRFLLQPLIFLEITHALAAEPCLFLQSFGGVQQGDLARHSRVAWEIRAVARSLMCSRDSKKHITLLRVILTVTDYVVIVSDISCGSIRSDIPVWHSIWLSILTFFTDILSGQSIWHSFWAFILTFFSGILSSIYSDLLSDIGHCRTSASARSQY